MEENRFPEDRTPRTEHRALVQKTSVDADGVVRRTSIGEDGTIYRTVMYPDGTVKRLKKAPTPESIAAAKEALAKLEEPLGEQMEASRRVQNVPEEPYPGSALQSRHDESDVIEDAIRKIQQDNIRTEEESGDADRLQMEIDITGDGKPQKVRARSSYEERPREHYYDETRKPRKKKKAPGIIIMIAVILAIAAAFWFTVGNKYTPGTETADLDEYFGLTDASQSIIVIDNMLIENKGLIRDGAAYIDYGTVSELINSRVYIDESENILLYSMPTYTIRIEAGATVYDDNGTTVEIGHEIFVTENETKYVSLEFIQKFTSMEGAYYDSPNRIVISLSEESINVATLTRDAEMRELGGNKSPIMANYSEGTEFAVLEVGDPWTKVASSDGLIGYVRDKKLSAVTVKDMSREFEAPVYTNISRDQTIHMAWFQSTSEIANGYLKDMVANTEGLNVIAPTWFFLKDSEGTVASIATSEAVNEAHSLGLEVWAVANDFDGATIYGGPDSSEATYNILSNTTKRTHVEEMIIREALDVGLDGINIDYENVSEECGPHYIQFIRELSILCRNNGLVLSVDSYVPSAWTTQYHREEQGEIADYVVIMAYDETGSWSDGMGSNSDIAYVTDAINSITQKVDPSKVIMGIPFYTRIWEEAPMEGTAGTILTCNTYGMADCKSILDANGAEYTWNDECGQYIATYSSGECNYTVWVEDTESLRLKLDAISAGGLAGWSCWKLGQETLDVWDLLVQY